MLPILNYQIPSKVNLNTSVAESTAVLPQVAAPAVGIPFLNEVVEYSLFDALPCHFE